MTDALLWQRWQSRRDPEAFAEILTRHSGHVLGTCRRIVGNESDAEDVAQECFVELLRGRLRVRGALAPLLHTLAVRRSRDFLRTRRRRAIREARAGGLAASCDGPRREQDELAEILNGVDSAIEALPRSLRVPLVRRYLEGRTNTAIATELGVAESTVRHRVRQGVERVRRRLERAGLTITSGALVSTLMTDSSRAASPELLARLGKLALTCHPPAVGVATALSAMKLAAPVAVLLLLTLLVATALRRDLFRAVDEVVTPMDEAAIENELPVARRPAAPPANVATSQAIVLRGIVRDAETRAPLESVTVEAGGITVVSDGAGRFRIEELAGERVRVTASLPGHVSLGVEATLQDRQDLELALEPALEVLVVDEDGLAVEGAEVEVFETVGARERVSGPHLTSETGRVFIADTPRVAVTDSSRLVRAIVHTHEGARESVWSGYTQVVEAARTRPADAESDADRAVRVILRESLLLAGEVRVPAGFDPTMVSVSLLRLSANSPHWAITGSDIDRSGASRRGLWRHLLEARPDPDGRFELAWVPIDSTVSLVADAPGLGAVARTGRDPIVLERVVLELREEGGIEGVLRFASSGLPAPSWRLAAHALDEHAGHGPVEVLTDGLGRYRFSGLAAGGYTLGMPIGADLEAGTVPVRGVAEVEPGEVVRGIDLVVEEGTIVRGRVVDDATGEPIAAAGLSAVQGAGDATRSVGQTTPDESGAYAIRLPSGPARIYLNYVPREYLRKGVERAIDVPSSGPAEISGIDFRLERGEQLMPSFLRLGRHFGFATGRVVDSDGRPIRGVAIEAHRQWILEEEERSRGPWINPTHRTTTDDDGRFRVAVCAEKPYRLVVAGREHSSRESELFRVERDVERDVGEFSLRRGTSFVSGSVVDSANEPVHGATVSARSKSKRRPREGLPQTDASGRFRVEHLLHDEEVRLTITKSGYEIGRATATPGRTDLHIILGRVPPGESDSR